MGMTPERLALCVGLGFAFGIIPSLGTTTILCTFTAFLCRLNLAAMLAANYLVYPIQLALLIPFIRGGEWLFGAEPLNLSTESIRQMMRDDLLKTVVSLAPTMIHALLVWLSVAPVVVALIFFVMKPLLRKLRLERLALES